MITQARVNELFDYCDGALVWRVSQGSRKAGTPAGTVDSNGRRRVKVDGKKYLEHRLVYLLHHGHLPEFLDHIDTDYTNNRVENLRPATKSTNNMNRGAQRGNKSGVKGVYQHKRSKKWVAQVYAYKKVVLYKEFDTMEDAETAAIAARREHHGAYAREIKQHNGD